MRSLSVDDARRLDVSSASPGDEAAEKSSGAEITKLKLEIVEQQQRINRLERELAFIRSQQ